MDENTNVHLSRLPEKVLQWNDLYKNERISIEKICSHVDHKRRQDIRERQG